MPLMNWSDDFSVNIRDIDSQHKKLVGMINDLHEAMRVRRGKDIVSGIVGRMKDYARVHFATEERYMERHGYPDLQAHRVAHDKFIEKTLDIELALQEGSTVMALEVLSFLRTWLTKHIQGADKAYAPFLREKGVR